jgi:hypothetical protein
MKIELAEDQRRWIEYELASGRFDTPEAVIGHAIEQAKLADLRAKIDAAIAGGGERTVEDVRAAVAGRIAKLVDEGF